MKISLETLQSERPVIEQLVLKSFECEIYLVDVKIDSKEFQVVDAQGKPLMFRSQLAAKKPFKGLGVSDTRLSHASPYNEMIGLECAAVEPMLVRLNNPDEDLS
ncbi:MAG: hypothetical protein HWE12_01240 [Oceanospirillaceae bacterium]|nr:hypothetical protein [Oceanospirillaceae bacterium]